MNKPMVPVRRLHGDIPQLLTRLRRHRAFAPSPVGHHARHLPGTPDLFPAHRRRSPTPPPPPSTGVNGCTTA